MRQAGTPDPGRREADRVLVLRRHRFIPGSHGWELLISRSGEAGRRRLAVAGFRKMANNDAGLLITLTPATVAATAAWATASVAAWIAENVAASTAARPGPLPASGEAAVESAESLAMAGLVVQRPAAISRRRSRSASRCLPG